MAIKKNNIRVAITLRKSQLEKVMRECEERGISKSKLVEFALKKIGAL